MSVITARDGVIIAMVMMGLHAVVEDERWRKCMGVFVFLCPYVLDAML